MSRTPIQLSPFGDGTGPAEPTALARSGRPGARASCAAVAATVQSLKGSDTPATFVSNASVLDEVVASDDEFESAESHVARYREAGMSVPVGPVVDAAGAAERPASGPGVSEWSHAGARTGRRPRGDRLTRRSVRPGRGSVPVR